MEYRDFRKLCEESLQEEAPISMYSKNFGFITTDGKVVKGVPEEELHASVARRLGFKGQLPEQKAIQAGLVRFAVGDDGDATFQYIPSKSVNRYVANFIKKTAEIIGTVYIDLVRGGRVFRSEEWPVDKAMKLIPNLA